MKSKKREAATTRDSRVTEPAALTGGAPKWNWTSSPSLHLALIALVGILAYSNTFQVPFIFDDEGSILDNPVVKNLSSFLGGSGYHYNPRRFVGYLTVALNYRLGGLDVTGYHVFNLAIHIACAWLVFFFIRLTLKTPRLSSAGASRFAWAPLLAALLFVAHPVQTQAVTYIIQRLASLATLFYLAALIFYIKARLRQERTGNLLDGAVASLYLLSLVAALLAMKSKEISFTLPIVLTLYEFSFFGATTRKKLLFLLPIALTIVVVPLGLVHAGKPVGELLSDVSSMTRETTSISRGDYLLTQFSVIVTYLRLLVAPVLQNLDYDYPIYHSLFAPRVLLSVLLLCMLLAVALRLYFRQDEDREGAGAGRLVGFGILWFFITLSVESSVIPIRDVIYEHRLYLPSVGAFLAIAALGAPLAKGVYARSAVACAAVVIVLLAAGTWQRNEVWGSAISLWQDCVEKSPKKVRPYHNLANALTAAGRYDEAIEKLNFAVPLQPDNGATLRNLGAAYEKKGMLDRAIEQYGAAARVAPNDPYLHYNLGVAYARMGYAEPAIASFQRAIKLNPGYAEAYNDLGVAYGNQGLLDQAAAQFSAALRLNPSLAAAHGNLGFALGKQGKLAQAEEELEAAVALQPTDPQAYNNLGIVLEQRGDNRQAARNFEKAVALRPDNPAYSNNLYRVKLKGGTGS